MVTSLSGLGIAILSLGLELVVAAQSRDAEFHVLIDGPLCAQPDDNCQGFATDDATQSNSTAITSAEDFTPAVSGQFTDVCWWGAYLPAQGADDFTVTYYADTCGLPGAVVAGPFSQSGGTLSVLGPVDTGQIAGGVAPIYEFTGTHAPVPVWAGGAVWVEVKNDPPGGETWFWSWSFEGNLSRVVDVGPNGYDFLDIMFGADFALCVNVELAPTAHCVPPNNDDCVNAQPISGEGTFLFDNAGATTDGAGDALCAASGTNQIDQDVWFCWTATSSSDVEIGTCGFSSVDTRIAVYDGCGCPSAGGILVCNDDACGLQSRVLLGAMAGQQYLIRLGSTPGTPGGAGELAIAVVPACGDFDGDGDTDPNDFGVFSQCFTGANNPPNPSCPRGVDADLDNDGDVDLSDFVVFSQCFTGSQ